MKYLNDILILSLFMFTAIGCYQYMEVHEVKKESIENFNDIQAPSKIYLSDASMVIFENGFSVLNNHVVGIGQKYKIGSKAGIGGRYNISLDSILAMTYYENGTSDGRTAANILVNLFGIPLIGVSVYCVSCPKCCFGSCPTIYTFDGNKYNFETELFSYSISKPMEAYDLDVLHEKVPYDGKYKIMVTNEALETHFINKLELIELKHPPGTQVLPNPRGSYTMINELIPPDEVLNSENVNITDKVSKIDEKYYRSGIEMVDKLNYGPAYDSMKVHLKIKNGLRKVKVVVRYRNTLLSTILFYEVVLATQGIKAVEWTKKMNIDVTYSKQFEFVYKMFSGMDVSANENDLWEHVSHIPDAGPLNWKLIADEIPVQKNGDVNLNLKFIPDNFMIDFIGFDTSNISNDIISEKLIQPACMIDDHGDLRNDIVENLRSDDNKYHVTNPGDSYKITYNIPKDYSCDQTIMVRSKGYYTEWIRGSWIRNNNSDYKFNLYDIRSTLSYLAHAWVENKDIIENEFFRTRIPIKEGK